MRELNKATECKWKTHLCISIKTDFIEIEQYGNKKNTYYRVGNMRGLSDEQKKVALDIIIVSYPYDDETYFVVIDQDMALSISKLTCIKGPKGKYVSCFCCGKPVGGLHRNIKFDIGGEPCNGFQADHLKHQFDHRKHSIDEVCSEHSKALHSSGTVTVSSAKELIELLLM